MAYYFKVFDYVEELDCFLVNKEFTKAATSLGLTEWSSVVWIGRYFFLDNDFGEHWFDNWDERDEVWHNKAEHLGYDYDSLMVIDPDRFKDDKDGPCHNSELRRKFWTDVLKSLKISLDMMVAEARFLKEQIDTLYKNHVKPADSIENLEIKIQELIQKFNKKNLR